MKAFLFSFCYNVLYTLGWLVTLPSYLLKQKRRGGFGTGLMERFGLYRVSYNREPKGVLYVHAVSVGEVVLALKFLRAWLRERGGSAVLATSTATGHDTAVNAQVSGVRVIYAPFDLLGLPGKFFLMNLMSNVVWEAAVSTMRLHGTPLMVHCATRSLLWASLVSRTGFRSVMETTGLAWAGSGCSAAERGSAPNARRAAEARKRLHGKSIPYW